MDSVEWLAEIEEWQQAHVGVDPYDWTSFRRSMIAGVGRDPGIVPLPPFLAFAAEDAEDAHATTDREAEEAMTFDAGLEKAASE